MLVSICGGYLVRQIVLMGLLSSPPTGDAKNEKNKVKRSQSASVSGVIVLREIEPCEGIRECSASVSGVSVLSADLC